jgi:dihydroorotate dehydrogenase electron transfer subunit
LITPGDYDCVVTHSREILPGVIRVAFECDRIASSARPGQFVQIEPSTGAFPVTRRPITINRLTDHGFELLFDVAGRGTRLLSLVTRGDSVRVLGPLGRGWIISPGTSWLLIGGGLGVAGFQFLLDSVQKAEVLSGASCRDRVIPLMHPSCLCSVVTEDGSQGGRGLVTSLLSLNILQRADSIAVCGPVAMMNAVWNSIPEIHRHKIQISTESRMGCGWGVCDGCSIPVTGGGYKKCCHDGPVFPGTEIDWKRWKESGL